MKVLIVEDDVVLAKLIKMHLEADGYETDVANDGEAGLQKAKTNNYDILLLDNYLPGLDGIEIVAELRKSDIGLPVVMVTRNQSEEFILSSFEKGADDYLNKPIDFDFLKAKIRSILRRVNMSKSNMLRCGDVVLEPQTRMVTVAGDPVIMTNKEFTLLEFLVRNKNQKLSRGVLLKKLWKSKPEGESNIIDVYIKRIRSKIDAGKPKSMIKNIRNYGYKIVDPQNQN